MANLRLVATKLVAGVRATGVPQIDIIGLDVVVAGHLRHLVVLTE